MAQEEHPPQDRVGVTPPTFIITMELDIYKIEEKEGKKGQFLLLETNDGAVYVFPNAFDGDFDAITTLEGKRIEGGVTVGTYPQLKKIDKIIGDIPEKEKPRDRDRTISRIACINSAIKIIEASEETPSLDKTEKIVLVNAERLFEFIGK